MKYSKQVFIFAIIFILLGFGIIFYLHKNNAPSPAVSPNIIHDRQVNWSEAQASLRQCQITKIVHYHRNCPGNPDYSFAYLKDNSRLEIDDTPTVNELNSATQAIIPICGPILVNAVNFPECQRID